MKVYVREKNLDFQMRADKSRIRKIGGESLEELTCKFEALKHAYNQVSTAVTDFTFTNFNLCILAERY